MERKIEEELAAFERLLNIMDELRAKCPWDKKQTIESLRHLTIEETYELSDAILKNDIQEIKRELGDILLHIVFYAKVASEDDQFTIKDVINSLNEKLIRRHPHVFGDVKVNNAEDVKENWENIKRDLEKKTTLGGVPDSLPSLIKAHRIQEKARGVGFDWEEPQQVIDKVMEELNELKFEIEQNTDKNKIEEEFGDLFFSLINYARFIDVNPEDALSKTNNKFIKRFNYLEEQSTKAGLQLKNMSLAEMDVYWNEAKKLD